MQGKRGEDQPRIRYNRNDLQKHDCINFTNKTEIEKTSDQMRKMYEETS